MRPQISVPGVPVQMHPRWCGKKGAEGGGGGGGGEGEERGVLIGCSNSWKYIAATGRVREVAEGGEKKEEGFTKKEARRWAEEAASGKHKTSLMPRGRREGHTLRGAELMVASTKGWIQQGLEARACTTHTHPDSY